MIKRGSMSTVAPIWWTYPKESPLTSHLCDCQRVGVTSSLASCQCLDRSSRRGDSSRGGDSSFPTVKTLLLVSDRNCKHDMLRVTSVEFPGRNYRLMNISGVSRSVVGHISERNTVIFRIVWYNAARDRLKNRWLSAPRSVQHLLEPGVYLWNGNVFWTADGAVLIDPAAHGGHRETDLAMLELFGCPYRESVVDGYQSVHPLRDGWQARIPLHQLHPLAVHAAGHGAAYGRALHDAALQTIRLAGH
ncbi:hypothetical protein FOY51_06140 [Antrihabitans cavernicola]|uniref:Uncharacterized protein n=1 Tax=Antrihabitans cavernicola TaxID=2495913 RepID=A0A5A7SIE5_9NOCA|nr:hypothetical protein FOY51_06140 [Spelaeibacter cavernicola]